MDCWRWRWHEPASFVLLFVLGGGNDGADDDDDDDGSSLLSPFPSLEGACSSSCGSFSLLLLLFDTAVPPLV